MMRFVGLLAATCLPFASALITVPAIFSDGFVLQRHYAYDQRPFIYGYSDQTQELVTVVRQQPNGSNDTYLATTDAATGFWIVQADPDYFADNQNNLTFYIYGSLSKNIIIIRNAAYGDVFLCS